MSLHVILGPGSDKTGMANITVFSNLAKHKKAQCLVNANTPHSYTYVPDAAMALYLLSKDATAFNQTWHLPTKSPALTGKAFIELAASAWNQPPKYIVFAKWMVKALGLFVTEMNEIHEMLYQNEFPYLFDAAKFEKHFNFTPTSYEAGIEQCRDYYQKL
jgi:nucleoside-diphosphate-sugar epimerase